MFSRWQKTSIALTMVTALLTAGCSSGLVKSLGDLNALRQHLIQKYQDEVNVNLQNSRFLSVVFINSPLNKLEVYKRDARAQDAAAFVALNYEGIKSVERIFIAFVESENYFIFFHYTRGLNSYMFYNNGALVNKNMLEEPREPLVEFSSARNETDVSIIRLQLEGDMNHGVAMVPSFTVPGNRDQNGKVARPKEVTLDFASYADRRVFLPNNDLIIQGDDQTIFTGSANLLVPDIAAPNGSDAPQFLTVKIPFEQFAAIGNANKVRIRLGPKEFQMTPADVGSLRQMAAYVAPLPAPRRKPG